MGSRLNPYISFDGDARQAMEFYKEVFGGDLSLNTFGESGQQGTPHAEQIMHAMLEAPNGFTLMAADTPPGMQHNPGTNFSVSLSGDDETELRGYWDKLSAGGTVAVPMEKQMWGDVFGMCTDRFGIPWMVNISEPES
ncbi:VOC family protein [Streptomyces sp. NBC_01381]|uniref:VOC family protein n=1 Tax=unclassified Streptomyces TaxID=2593676 RepID=UPI00225A5FBB|nr:VOC family protein [Streptomyces sp. NBC_01381]MCX4673221.1 VOC family protein [Streptomyces sp. NBC_01381]